MGSSNETSYFGPVFNPWRAKNSNQSWCRADRRAVRPRRSPDFCVWRATGTDTGGSIRQPAAVTGTVGLKPTYGRCSRWGIVAFASSLDQAGPMTRTVRDAAIMLRHMASVDPKDSTSVDMPGARLRSDAGKRRKGSARRHPKEYRIDGAPPEIDALWDKGAEWLKAPGAEIVDV